MVRNIKELPNDCIYEIYKYLSIYDIYRIETDINVKKEYLILISNRIKLIKKINNEISGFKSAFCVNIKRCFKVPYFTVPRTPCMFYAPIVPNGICRICNKHENKHIIREKSLNILLDFWHDDIYSNTL